MKRTLFVSSLCVALLVVLGACGVGSGTGTGPPPSGAFDLIVEGGVGFQVPHGGQSISVALLPVGVRVVARETGTVSPSADPAFSFTFRDLLVEGLRSEIHYWIDSNDGGGTEGICDPNDHQASVAIFPGQGDLFIFLDHDDNDQIFVCSTFEG